MQRIFEDGEIIFSEGDAGDTAFVIKSGTVTLDKAGTKGPVHIADLGRGELLGEMGALDGSPRSATARAKGKTTLHTIPRNEFLGLVTKDPDMAMRVMTKLVERLRAADERLAKYESSHLPARTVGEPPIKAVKTAKAETPLEKADKPAAKAAPAPTDTARNGENGENGEDKETDGLLAKIFGLGRKKPDGDGKKAPPKDKPGKKAAPPKPAKPMSVAVHPIAGDDNGALRKVIVGGLEKIDGLIVTPLKKPLSSAPEPDFNSVMTTQVREGRAWLTKNDVDLMIAGGLEPTGRLLELRLVKADPEPGDRPATAPAHTPLYIPPTEGETPIAPLWQELCAAAVAASLPARSRAQMGAVLQITQGVGAGLSGLKDLEMPELSPQERAAVLIHGANILAASANLSGNPADLDTAIDLNRFALRLLQTGESPIWPDAQRQLALALLALSERGDDAELLEWAADALRAALSRTPRDRMPWTWGRLQNRLGQALYRLDLEKMSEAALKESVNAFQMSLQVLDKSKDAVVWSETMNNLSQSLQLYGEQTGNQTVISRAVDSARAALDNCAADDTPFLWAAIQNNLGAAYFLWGKNGGGRDKLEAAEEAFSAALTVYQETNSPKMAEVSEKNLRRTQSQLRVTQSRGGTVAEPDWAAKNDDSDKPTEKTDEKGRE